MPMYWTLLLATQLEDAPWPSTKYELIDYATRSCLDPQIVENLAELEDDGEEYECISDIWMEYDEWRYRVSEANDECEYF